MASIRKRGDLQWEARIRREGHSVTCKTFNTKADAEKWARDGEGEMDKGVFVARKEAENTTLKDGLERFIAEYIPQYKHADIREYTARALQRRKIATKFMATVRGKDIAEYIRERENEGMSGNETSVCGRNAPLRRNHQGNRREPRSQGMFPVILRSDTVHRVLPDS